MSDRPVALVSGSSRGIGKGIAEALAAAGYRVAVTGRTRAEVEAVAAAVAGEPFVFDLTRDEEVAACVDAVVARCGRLDAVIANLGSGRSVPGAIVPLEEMQRVLTLNFFAAVMLCNHAIPRLTAPGAIVLIGSIVGGEALRAPIAYSAAKAALASYGKSLSLLLAERDIRVNVVSPGNIMFPGGSWDERRQKDEPGVRDYVAANVPMNRFGTPEDIGQAVAFVLRAPFMTGHNLIVDGGQSRRVL